MNPALMKRWPRQQHPQHPAIGCGADELQPYPAPDCVTLGKSVNLLKSQLLHPQHREGGLAGWTQGNQSQITFGSVLGPHEYVLLFNVALQSGCHSPHLAVVTSILFLSLCYFWGRASGKRLAHCTLPTLPPS